MQNRRETKGILKWTTISFGSLSMLVSGFYIFHWFPFGFMVHEFSYMLLLVALLISPIFLLYPTSKSLAKPKVPWYDVCLFFLSLAIPLFFASKGYTLASKGWEFTAPAYASVLIAVEFFLVLEACRRSSGIPLTVVCALFLFFPLFSAHAPGLLQGMGYSFLGTMSFMGFSREGLLGIPIRVFGNLVIGFMIFAVAMIHVGAGRFFIDLGTALLGRTRGGLAKVAIFASAFTGSISGSPISNVFTTGSFTIPAIKKAGYPKEFAAAIEACASTGGALMPPVMGVAAFIMAEFLGIPYYSICLAAAVPSILYYFALYMQVDAYAAKMGYEGIPLEEKIPPFWGTLKRGWIYILPFIVLAYFLVYEATESQAPFYATGALLVLAMTRKATRFSLKSFVGFLEECSKFLASFVVILASISFILGSLSMTGVGAGLASGIVHLGGGNVFVLLVLGAATSSILGMGMTMTACYIFLAMVLAPALIEGGIYPLAAHLFIMYWGMTSFITPPVALSAYAAAAIADANPVKTGVKAMRLGLSIYIVPFFFVLNPALILHGPSLEVVLAVLSAIVGMGLIGQALEGYLVKAGTMGRLGRIFVFVSGILLAFPGLSFRDIYSFPGWPLDLLGLIMLGLFIGTVSFKRQNQSISQIHARKSTTLKRGQSKFKTLRHLDTHSGT